MAKKFTQKELIELKNSALNNINTYLTTLIHSKNSSKNKQASLISYWLNDYFRLLSMEDDFNYHRLISYKRGDIVKIHLGYRLGHEQGGLHYAVVLDNDNKKSNGTLTVVPLSSIKLGKSIHPSCVEIGTEIFTSIISKHDKMSNQINEKLEQLLDESDTNNSKYDLSKEVVQLKKDLNNLANIRKEILKMKEGSVALCNQITTISKLRIVDPKYTYNVLYGIRLQPTTLSTINDKLCELYIYQ